SQRCRVKRAEAVDTAVVDGEGRIEGKVVEVAAKFQIVMTESDRKVVGELITLFGTPDVGVRLPSKVRETGNIHGHITAASRIGKEIRQSATSVLEAEFVDLVVAECPRVLEDACGIS